MGTPQKKGGAGRENSTSDKKRAVRALHERKTGAKILRSLPEIKTGSEISTLRILPNEKWSRNLQNFQIYARQLGDRKVHFKNSVLHGFGPRFWRELMSKTGGDHDIIDLRIQGFLKQRREMRGAVALECLDSKIIKKVMCFSMFA